MLNWKIWFSDGNRFITKTNLNTAIPDLPILPVVIIAIIRRDNNGSRFCLEFGRNYYCLVGNEWWASTLSGLLNYLDFHRGNGAILRGGMVSNALFKEAYEQAKHDPDILAATREEFVRDIDEAND